LIFDLDYRVTTFQVSATGGNLRNQTYTLDYVENITAVSDTVSTANNQTLGYDVLNRLTSATSGSGGYGSLAYTYDGVGNRLSQTVNSSTTTYAYTSGTNRLASITNGGTTTVSTSANGSITSIPPANGTSAATFAYNVAGRLSSVTGSPTAISAIVYDGFGQRFSKQDPSTTAYYTYGTDGTLLEENDNGAVTDYIYLNGVPVGVWLPSTSTLYYVQSDWLGTPQMVTDSSQNVVWSTRYQPFGTTPTPTGSITQNLRLPGQFSDAETGFNYNHFRDYMPNLGRYLQADPIGLRGGLNPYLYVSANPGRLTDRWGLATMTPEERQEPTDYFEYWSKATFWEGVFVSTFFFPEGIPFSLTLETVSAMCKTEAALLNPSPLDPTKEGIDSTIDQLLDETPYSLPWATYQVLMQATPPPLPTDSPDGSCPSDVSGTLHICIHPYH
jgi:RHS repeat-associated protein